MRNIPCAGASLPRNDGFSLIEGVVIVSLIGIVAAFAVSRFTRLANTARATEVVAVGVAEAGVLLISSEILTVIRSAWGSV